MQRDNRGLRPGDCCPHPRDTWTAGSPQEWRFCPEAGGTGPYTPASAAVL